jgi:DNA mismatch repair protein MutL
VAIPFNTESPGDDLFLKKRKDDLARLGVCIEEDGSAWRVEALPSGWRLSDGETVKEILSLKSAGENMAERWAAALSCRKAVKDGDYLDEGTALALAEAAFKLPVRRCPHGRPIWFEVSRDELLRAVKRT